MVSIACYTASLDIKILNGGKSSLRTLMVTFALISACDLTFSKVKNIKIRKGV